MLQIKKTRVTFEEEDPILIHERARAKFAQTNSNVPLDSLYSFLPSGEAIRFSAIDQAKMGKTKTLMTPQIWERLTPSQQKHLKNNYFKGYDDERYELYLPPGMMKQLDMEEYFKNRSMTKISSKVRYNPSFKFIDYRGNVALTFTKVISNFLKENTHKELVTYLEIFRSIGEAPLESPNLEDIMSFMKRNHIRGTICHQENNDEPGKTISVEVSSTLPHLRLLLYKGLCVRMIKSQMKNCAE